MQKKFFFCLVFPYVFFFDDNFAKFTEFVEFLLKVQKSSRKKSQVSAHYIIYKPLPPPFNLINNFIFLSKLLKNIFEIKIKYGVLQHLKHFQFYASSDLILRNTEYIQAGGILLLGLTQEYSVD